MPYTAHRLVSVLVLLFAAPVFAQAERTAAPTERYSEVLLPLPSPLAEARPAAALAERLAAHGLVLDHARLEATPDGPALRTVLSETELALARAAGVEAEVLVADLAAEVAARVPMTEAERQAALAEGGIDGNIFGSMGGYPTFSEALAILDDMRAQYPHLISARLSLGQSHEGRDVWMVEVSDNPGVDEGEPEVLITSLHHAREPAGLTTVLYTLWYLLENYEDDPQIRYLVNNRRLFVVPVLNPDGYVYNETTDPDGGGMWRKNRRDNGSSFGVDLNRNYGYLWGLDNQGSSGNPSSETYRGPSAFSEPEAQALRDFLEGGRSVRAAFNYHTYGDLLLFPWGYEVAYTPDHDLFVTASQQMTAVNGYTYGIAPEILYATNGSSDDWMYGEQTTKRKIFAFTPEVGPWFWPSSSQIVPLAEENLRANLLLLYYAGRRPSTSAAADFLALSEASAGAEGVTLAVPYPNPASGAATVTFTLPQAAPVRLAVYDVLGREVAVLVDGLVGEGRHEAVLEGASLPGGTYLVRLMAGGAVETQRVTLVR